MRKRQTRRRLSMTSLIDVIFLLLLFFMLTSTFSKFAEVDLTSAARGAAVASQQKPLFLKLGEDRLSLNGRDTELPELPQTLQDLQSGDEPTVMLISLDNDVMSQRLVDLLVVLRGVENLKFTVLGGA